jgi:integrase/recombinase XerD
MTITIEPLGFADAVDEYIVDMRSQGRATSDNTTLRYRQVLTLHCSDAAGQSPAVTTRDDVKRTLRRWAQPNSQRQAHSILTSFYDWMIEEGLRDTINPARQVRRARSRSTAVFRPTREEVGRLIAASNADRRERWVIHLGVLVGLRRGELCGLRGRHFARTGWVWVSADIAKGKRERWVPVLPELAPIVAEIVARVGLDEYVIPSVQRGGGRGGRPLRELPDVPMTGEGMFKLVRRVGRRAGIGHDIGAHSLRHAFGDHIARGAGLRAAQAMLGHANVSTTQQTYVGRVPLDELAASVRGVRYDNGGAHER